MKIISKDTLSSASQPTKQTQQHADSPKTKVQTVVKNTKISKTPVQPATPARTQSVQKKAEPRPPSVSNDSRRSSSRTVNQNVKPNRTVKKKNVVENRKDHLAREKELRESGQSYLSIQYNKFTSLIRFNITFKLTIGYALRLLFLIGFLFATIYIAFSYYLFYDKQQDMKSELAYVEDLIIQKQSFDSEEMNLFLQNHKLDLFIFDRTNQLIHQTVEMAPTYEAATSIVEYNIREFPNFPNLYRSKTITFKDQSTYTVSLYAILDNEKNVVEATFPIGIVLCIVLILSSVRSASKMAKKHMSPILNMTEQVKDMSANNLSTRLNISGTKDELKDLAATFNKMLDDIQKSYEREKQFVSDASHELRTPIAVIKGYAGMLNRWGKDDAAILDESIHAILSETDNMHSLVESLLFIARNDKGTLKMDKCQFNFSDLFTEIVKETHLIDSQHAITEQIETDIHLYGSADKLKQAIRIFIDNSI